MGILKFKNPFSKNSPEIQDYLSLTIAPNKIIATIWNFQGEDINILSSAEKEFGSVENIIHEAAVVIDNAAEKAKTDVSQVVFGLSHFWFEDDKLKPEISKTLKELSGDLELDAQAFVTLAIAINHMIKIEQAVTPQAILVGHFGNFCEVHLIKNNKVVETKTIEGEITSHKVIHLIEEIKGKHENLPSKIIVFGKDKDALVGKLSQANWQEIFVHEPKIESLEDNELGRSVAFAQAADLLGRDPNIKSEAEEKIEEKKEPQIDTPPLTASAGFVEGEDILLEQNQNPEEDESSAQEATAVSPNLEKEKLAVSDNLEFTQEPEEVEQKPKKHRKSLIPKLSFSKFIPNKLTPKKIALIAGIFILLLFGGTFVAGQTLTTANVLIKANTKTETFDFNVKVISGNSNNFEKGEIAGKSVTGNAEGSQKAVATGAKKTGTNAKGQIKILNWDKESGKTFSSGTEVITDEGLKFKIDSEVSVASRSATTPGEAKVGATASDIGPKYNIGSGKDLTIVGFDEVFYSGITDTDFSGGDEKEITVVSQDDLAKLEKALTDSLTEKAKADLENKIAGAKIYDESKIVKVAKKTFDKQEDEEASLVNLDMSIDFEAIAFEENDLKNYLAELTNKDLEGGKEALPDTIGIRDVKVNRNKDILTISGNYEVGITNKLEVEKLKSEIAGKSVKDARSVIMGAGDVANVQITFTPTIPFIDSLPRNQSKINIKIEKN